MGFQDGFYLVQIRHAPDQKCFHLRLQHRFYGVSKGELAELSVQARDELQMLVQRSNRGEVELRAGRNVKVCTLSRRGVHERES